VEDVKASLFTLRYRAKLATANAVSTLLLRKVNQSILTSAKTLIYRCENSAQTQKTRCISATGFFNCPGQPLLAMFYFHMGSPAGRAHTIIDAIVQNERLRTQ